MRLPPERPLTLVCCYAVIRAAALLVPEHGYPLTRHAWIVAWQEKMLERWQLYRLADAWNGFEALRLTALSTLSFGDAARQMLMQEALQQKLRRIIQSPATCLGVLAALLLVITVCSGGLPATRDLIFKRFDTGDSRLVFAWLHTMRGDGDRPLPSDVIPAWNQHGKLVQSAAAFRASHRPVQLPDGEKARPLVISTEPNFFKVLNIQPAIGSIPSEPGIVLSYSAWYRIFRADPRVLGSQVIVGKEPFAVQAILPAHAEPLTRQPVLYLINPSLRSSDVYAVLRASKGVSSRQLNAELTKIAEDVTYYFLQGQLRSSFAQSAALTPVWSFVWATVASAALLLVAFRTKWSIFRQATQRQHRRIFAHQALFFFLKTGLALACVFTACLEWSRSPSAILFGNFDPASGPFLLWLYIVGAMGVLFWTVIDQKARCRECLRLLVFPVRIGSPGSMLLDWSGTEFCCSEGHGVLHVPHLAPSWSDEADHWISLDQSWQSLFRDSVN